MSVSPGADQNFFALPRCVAQEVLADGSCPLHLRLQLSRSLGRNPTLCGTSPALFAESRCMASVVSFLSHGDVLATRATGVAVLCDAMQRCEEPCAKKTVLAELHDRIRARLWLTRLGSVTENTPDESVFETQVKSFVDDAMRRRLEAEVATAKIRMEEEVRDAKATMVQLVQTVSDEVDRRVRDKVAALQEEFERRTEEQARTLREMVERRVCEQTSALQVEVDRRTDLVRAAMEQRAHEQEEAASKLRIEVNETRAALEERVRTQEAAAEHLACELGGLRKQLLELGGIRDALEARVAEQEALLSDLTAKLLAATALPGFGPLPRTPLHNHSGCWPCLAWFRNGVCSTLIKDSKAKHSI